MTVQGGIACGDHPSRFLQGVGGRWGGSGMGELRARPVAGLRRDVAAEDLAGHRGAHDLPVLRRRVLDDRLPASATTAPTSSRRSCTSRATPTAPSTAARCAPRARRPCSWPSTRTAILRPMYRGAGCRRVGADRVGRGPRPSRPPHEGRPRQELITQGRGRPEVNRNEGFGFLGGATITNEEGYLRPSSSGRLGCST